MMIYFSHRTRTSGIAVPQTLLRLSGLVRNKIILTCITICDNLMTWTFDRPSETS